MNKKDFMDLYNKCLKHTLDKTQADLSNWNLEFSGNMTRTAGYCNYSKKLFKFSKLFIRSHNSYDIKLVILHEFAHALTPLAKHGKDWKNMCLFLGGDGNQYLKDEKFVELTSKIKISCSHCGNIVYSNTRKQILGATCTCGHVMTITNNKNYYKNLEK